VIIAQKAEDGEISHLAVHPQFFFVIDGEQLKHDNGRRVGYKADFQFFEGDLNVVEDCKGMVTSDWPLRKSVFKLCSLSSRSG